MENKTYWILLLFRVGLAILSEVTTSHFIAIFGRPRIEYICPFGHGTLKEAELQISGLENPEWKPNADYLFSSYKKFPPAVFWLFMKRLRHWNSLDLCDDGEMDHDDADLRESDWGGPEDRSAFRTFRQAIPSFSVHPKITNTLFLFSSPSPSF